MDLVEQAAAADRAGRFLPPGADSHKGPPGDWAGVFGGPEAGYGTEPVRRGCRRQTASEGI